MLAFYRVSRPVLLRDPIVLWFKERGPDSVSPPLYTRIFHKYFTLMRLKSRSVMNRDVTSGVATFTSTETGTVVSSKPVQNGLSKKDKKGRNDKW